MTLILFGGYFVVFFTSRSLKRTGQNWWGSILMMLGHVSNVNKAIQPTNIRPSQVSRRLSRNSRAAGYSLHLTVFHRNGRLMSSRWGVPLHQANWRRLNVSPILAHWRGPRDTRRCCHCHTRRAGSCLSGSFQTLEESGMTLNING